jgi:hypothetical protein
LTAQAFVEATEAEASARDAGRADVKEVAVEVPPEAGQEAAQPGEAQPGEPQPQQDRPEEPMVKVESGAVAPLPMVTAAVPVIEAPALAQGSTPAVVDLTLDDSPVDKGK